MNLSLRLAAVFILVFGGVEIASAAPTYRVHYLGIAISNGLVARINNHGQIVGSFGVDGFIYNAGQTVRLHPLGAPFGNIPLAINEVGQVAGNALADDYVGHAYLYTGGLLTDLGVLPGYRSSSATDLNDAGEVVGASYSPDGTSARAFLYRNGTLIDLGPGIANAINESGIIVGTADYRAVRYENGAVIDLGDFGESPLTNAIDINDPGQIVGYSYVQTTGGFFVAHPFLYESGVWRDLGLPPGVPLGIPSAINNAGQIVGNSNLSLGSDNRPPFLYTDGTIYNLQSLLDSSGAGLTLQLAYDINDSGRILAQGRAGSGYAVVLLIPVPEPSSASLVLLLGLGLSVLIRRHG
jgi:probable HAF family extracellular repeat protein